MVEIRSSKAKFVVNSRTRTRDLIAYGSRWWDGTPERNALFTADDDTGLL